MSQLIEESHTPSLTKIGGLPTGVDEFTWPVCRSCKGSMQFVAQINFADLNDPTFNSRPGMLLIFICQNDPGMCDDWDANSGGNAIVIVEAGTAVIHAPTDGETVLPKETFVVLKPDDSGKTEETDEDNYIASVNENQRILGKTGGKPLWIQGDETPDCKCGASMKFVAMLEERGGGGINFGGGGVGYAFACANCKEKAKFLWQS